jgi:predicted DNA-binding transcriptional regulator YafY
MARPTARVLAVLEILQSGGTHTAADLAARLGVDERTARRYVAHLVDLDVPVRPVRGRHGGYRIEAGYRMPPLMLADDEALALVLGLIAADRAGLITTTRDAGERAAAKLRRVLPDRTRRRLDALAAALGVTTPARASAGVDTDVLFTLAGAARERRPVAISYTSRDGRPTARTLEPYGIVAHSGHWYVTGGDSASGQVRTFRLDRLRFPRTLPGHFDVPDGFDATGAVLDSLATAPWAHAVSVRVRSTAADLRVRLPPGLARLEHVDDEWTRIRLRAARLDWVPALLAGLDRPFVIEAPEQLRERVDALARRLHHDAHLP